MSPGDARWLPLAAARGKDATLVKLLSDLSDAGDPLSLNIIQDRPQVRRVLLGLQFDRCDGFLVANLLTA